uniref:RdRP n=1 Tax=Pepper virus A TaxID=1803898 RepID=A0A6G5VXK1_9VIRU|nr:RdRP [Pepper virus A]
MALTYRTPMEDIVASFEPAVQATIANTAAVSYKNLESSNFNIANFHLDAVAKQELSRAGLYLSPYSAIVHSHPVCKTLENYMLLSVLPSYIDNKFFFVGIKDHKLQLLKQRHQDVSLVTAINRYVTSRDKVRYGNEFVIRSTLPHQGLNRQKGCLEDITLRDLVPELVTRGSKYLFFHDELHYWKKKDLITFLEVLKPEVMLGTIVYPPELLIGAKSSLNPWCYEYEIKGQLLLFYPDGVRTEGYEQPLHGGYLLKCSTVVLPDGTVYKVDLLCSKFAHHLISLTKGEMESTKYRSFDKFQAIAFDSLADLTAERLPYYPISFSVVSKLYRYIKSLKKPDAQSAMAKLSQIVPEPTAFEIKFVQEFSALVMDAKGLRSTICPDVWRSFMKDCYSGVLPSWLSRQLDVVKEVSLDRFVSSMRPLCITVKLEECNHKSADLIFEWDQLFIEEGVDIVDALGRFNGESIDPAKLWPHVGAPYVGLAPIAERPKKCLLHVPAANLKGALKRVVLKCYAPCAVSDGTDGEVLELILALLNKSGFLSMKALSASGEEHSDLVRTVVYAVKFLTDRRCSASFFAVGLAWFSKVKRGNMHYMDHLSTGAAVPRHIKQKWSSVVAQIRDRGSDGGPQGSPAVSGSESAEFKDEGESDATLCNPVRCPTIHRGTQCNAEIGQSYTILVCPHEWGVKKELPGVWDEGGNAFLRYVGPSQLNQASMLIRDVSNLPDYAFASKCKSYEWPEWLDIWSDLSGITARFDRCVIQQCFGHSCRPATHAINHVLRSEITELYVPAIKGDLGISFNCCGKDADFRLNEGHILQLGTVASVDTLTLEHTGSCTIGLLYKVVNASVVEAVDERACEAQDQDAGNDAEQNTEARSQRGEIKENTIPGKRLESRCCIGGPGRPEQIGSNQISAGVSGPSGCPDKSSVFKVTADVELSVQTSVACAPTGYSGNKFGALAKGLGLREDTTVQFVNEGLEFLATQQIEPRGSILGCLDNARQSVLEVCAFVTVYTTCVLLIDDEQDVSLRVGPREGTGKVWPSCYIRLGGGSSGAVFCLEYPRNQCVLVAMAQALQRDVSELRTVLTRDGYDRINESLHSGLGLELCDIEQLCGIFSINAIIQTPRRRLSLNPQGKTHAYFTLEDEHLTYCKKVKTHAFNQMTDLAVSNAVSEAAFAEVTTVASPLTFEVSTARAKLLADSFHEGSTGVSMSELFNSEYNLREHIRSDVELDAKMAVYGVFGTFGAGKSRIFKNLCGKAGGKRFFYVSPRQAFLKEVKSDIGFETDMKSRLRKGQQNWYLLTFERFVQKARTLCVSDVVIIDEIQLYPPGYLDLVIYLMPAGVRLVVMGDPCQSDYDNEKDSNNFVGVPDCATSLLQKQEYRFNIESRRFKNANFIGRLPCCISETQCSINEEYIIREGLDHLVEFDQKYLEVVLVSSFDERKVVRSYLGPDCNVQTFGESTGMNYKNGTIVITGVSAKASERRWVTALSRFSENVAFCNATGLNLDTLMLVYKDRCLHKFFTGRATVTDLKSYLPGTPIFKKGFYRVGKDEGVRKETLSGDPWLKGMMDLAQTEDVQRRELQAIEEAQESFKIHLARREPEGTRTGGVHRILNKEIREHRIGTLVSDQFTDDHSKQRNAIQLTNAAERFETIYPRHRASDTVTFIMAVKKRLRFSKPAKEMGKLHNARPFGKFLLNQFLSKVPLKPHMDHAKMDLARNNFFDKKTSKSAATIENHSSRSCWDWLADVGMIFSKSQICTKFDNRFRMAKAAQSIVCFQHAVLCRFAPYMRYIEMKLQEALPERYYIHSGKGFEELNEWVIKGNFSGTCTESEYEAFDSSQDQYIMAFELELMKYLRLPLDLIKDYEYIKTHLGSKLGSFAIMRFSGEASTFLFNTMANMLFTFLRYHIRGDELICFAGDDMCSSKVQRKKSEHEGFLNKLSLKAKVQHTSTPTFCGWHLCPDGIYKKPQLVFERMCIAKETNNLANCIDNYAIEVSYAYRLGERITSRMDEEELGAYYGCVRTIIKYKHLLKSDIKHLFEEQ